MNKESYTAQEAASLLLQGADLSEREIEFLAVALVELATWHERMGDADSIDSHECTDELTEMNSQHREGIEPVVYALTGLSFGVSWRGKHGERTFSVEHHEKRDLQPRANFAALHAECGWGSGAHRQALRDFVVAHS